MTGYIYVKGRLPWNAPQAKTQDRSLKGAAFHRPETMYGAEEACFECPYADCGYNDIWSCPVVARSRGDQCKAGIRRSAAYEAVRARLEANPSLLDALPPKRGEAAALYYLQQIPTKEIAVRLDMRVNTVQSTIRRARQQLEELMSL